MIDSWNKQFIIFAWFLKLTLVHAELHQQKQSLMQKSPLEQVMTWNHCMLSCHGDKNTLTM